MCKRDYTTGAQGEVNLAAEAKDGSPVASKIEQPISKHYYRVVCAWCNEEMRPGNSEHVSHACCCNCKAKYFPLIGHGTEHRWQSIDLQHEERADGTAPSNVSVHVQTYECELCEMQYVDDENLCDCGGDD